VQVADAEGITAGKTDEELVAMLRCPQDWQPLVLDAARLELQKRNLPVPESPPAISIETTSIWSFQGRIPRSGFWVISISLTVFNLAVGILVGILGKYGIEAAGLLIDGAFLVIAVWISLATQVKRWHDLNRSGWMVLLNLTVIGLPVIVIYLGCVRGTAGPNRFGADPLQRSATAEVTGG
jgi:uncharacterized membrane protein YhaH (DUF805 family)